MSAKKKYTIVSADTHAGADLWDYKKYLPSSLHQEFDVWAEAYSSPWDDLVNDTAARNWDSELRRTHMEEDGVVAEVIFPNTIPPFFPSIVNVVPLPSTKEDYDKRWAGIQAHNRWLVDFCSELPVQRRGMVQVFPHNVEDAVKEIHWAAETGVIGGVVIPASPPNHPLALPHYTGHYDPVWRACEETGLVVGTHSGSGEPEYPDDPATSAIMLYEFGLFTNRTLSHMLIGGVFERFPNLKYSMTEQGVKWIAETVHRLEIQFSALTDRPWLEMFVKEAYDRLSLRPSEYFERNCFVGASTIRPGEIQPALGLGAGNVMWGSDYPHREGTGPYSREHLRVALQGVSEADARRLLGETCAEVYGFDLAALDKIAERVGPTVEELQVPLAAADYPRDSEWFQDAMQTLAR